MTSDTDRLNQGNAVIEHTYYAIWNDWFASTGVSRASFHLTHQCADSGYRPERDELHLNLPETNVEEAADDAASNYRTATPPTIGWPVWKRELVHEILHEYQHKVVAGQASPGGTALEGEHRGRFRGAGHGADYFTAAEEKASYFGGSPE